MSDLPPIPRRGKPPRKDGPDGRERVDRLADHTDRHKRFARDYSDHNQLICSMCAHIAEVERLRAERAPITYAPAEIMAERDEALAEVERLRDALERASECINDAAFPTQSEIIRKALEGNDG